MRRRLVVYIDTMGVGAAEVIADSAASRGIDTVLVCPRGAWPGPRDTFSRIIETADFSIGNLRRLLARLDRSHTIAGLHSLFGPFCRDGFLHAAVATLASERGLAHSPAAALAAATNKFLTRLALGTAGIPDIAYGMASDEMSLRAVAGSIGYPVVLKPLTGVGSSCIFRLDNERQVRATWRRALRALRDGFYEQLRMAPHAVATAQGAALFFDPIRTLLVETYIPGREASVECMVVGDRVLPLVVHDKLAVEERPGYVLEHMLVAPPLRFNAAEVRQLRAHAVRAVRALGLRDTFCHVELRWMEGVGPRILEINPRIGASCITDSIETFTDLDVGAARLDLILGRSPRMKRRRAARHAMIFLFAPRTGTLTRLVGIDAVLALPEVEAVRVMRDVGDPVGGDTDEGFIAGFWMRAATESEAQRAYARIRKMVTIEVK
jgi:biotin carboxylase